MDDRTRKILKEGVKDFIKTGKSITSGRLYEFHDFGIKPAMIRRELNSLDEAGFLKQLHPSGGRFPTNKAYKFFVEELISSDLNSQIKRQVAVQMVDNFLEGRKDILANDLANYLDLLSVVYEPSVENFHNSGLRELFDQVEAERKKDLSAVVRDFERLPYRLRKKKRWWESESSWPKVFIGSSPVTESKHLAVIAQRFSLNDENFLVMAIGPRRMDYRKPLGLFKYFEENI